MGIQLPLKKVAVQGAQCAVVLNLTHEDGKDCTQVAAVFEFERQLVL